MKASRVSIPPEAFLYENCEELDPDEITRDWYIPSNSLKEMGIPKNINISGGIHPTITWDSVLNADRYMVNFYSLHESGFPDFDVRLHTSGQITATSYTYTGDLFSDGKEYAIWVQAREFHPYFSIDPDKYRGLFINRSSYFTTYKVKATESSDVEEFVTRFYQLCLDRDPDAAE